jgi:hypothetical protein
LKNRGQPVDGVLVEEELVAEAVWACLDLASAGSREDVVELGGGGDVIRMRFGRATRRLCARAISASSARTDHPPWAARSASARQRRWSGSVSSAFPWPLVSAASLISSIA